MFGKYLRKTYYIFSCNFKYIIDITSYKKRIMKVVVYKDDKLLISTKNIEQKKNILFIDNKIALKLYFKKYYNLIDSSSVVNPYISYGYVVGNIFNDVVDCKVVCVYSKFKHVIKNYYYMVGVYEKFNGYFFIKLSDFNYNKAKSLFLNVYHNNLSKTRGYGRVSFRKSIISFKVSDYKNSVKFTIDKAVNDFYILDVFDVKRCISLNSNAQILIEDDNLTKVFNTKTANIILDYQIYLEDRMK